MGLISVVWRLKTPPLPMIDSPMFVNENSQDMLSTSSIFTTASKLEKARHDFNQIKKWEHLQVIHAAQAMISAYDKEASVDKVGQQCWSGTGTGIYNHKDISHPCRY